VIFEFDEDTAVVRTTDGHYEGKLVDRWSIGVGINGGYLAAFCLRAVLEESPLPDPLSMTVHYLSRPIPGPATVLVEVLRQGRGHATHRFDLLQEGELKATGLVLTGRHRDAGPLDFAPPRPDGAGPENSSRLRRLSTPGETISIWGRLEHRVRSTGDVFFLRAEPGEAQTGGWTRLADGRPLDALVVPVFLDCWPPAVFSRVGQPDPAGAPTLELTVHWRKPVAGAWLLARFETRQLAGGYLDENGELWSEDGQLVAESRQLARYGGAPVGPGRVDPAVPPTLA
jgi:acyl-CoA thioesterase